MATSASDLSTGDEDKEPVEIPESNGVPAGDRSKTPSNYGIEDISGWRVGRGPAR